ncbi:MAG: hypothetical protein ACMUEM_03190 [Flavobacteriales bacterium AspAUS03]
MYNVVQQFHDPNRQLLSETINALKNRRSLVMHISMLSSFAGYKLVGLLMRMIFNYN